MKRPDEKFVRTCAGHYTKADFVIAIAKDADMGSRCKTLVPMRQKDGSVVSGLRRLTTYLDLIAAAVRQDIVDIMLVSTLSLERSTEEGVFHDSALVRLRFGLSAECTASTVAPAAPLTAEGGPA